MTFRKARLAVSACLLAAWLCYLGYLVYETRDVVVLSKPQFMIAQLFVVVNVRDNDGRPDPDVAVVWASTPEVGMEPTRQVSVPELSTCTKEQGYRGAGKYLVPLIRTLNGYRIAPLPQREIRIYPWTSETEAQLQPFLAAKK